MQLLLSVGRWISHHVLVLVGIVVALLIANYLREHLPWAIRYVNLQASLPSMLEAVRSLHQNASAELERERRKRSTSSLPELKGLLNAAEMDAKRLQANAQKRCGTVELLIQGAEPCLKAKLNDQLATTKVELFNALVARADGARQLELLRRAHVDAYGKLMSAQKDLAVFTAANRLVILIPGTDANQHALTLRGNLSVLEAQNRDAHRAYKELESKIPRSRSQTETSMPSFNELEKIARQGLDEAKSHVGEWPIRLYQKTATVFVQALALLLLLIATPIVTRAALFSLVAPLANRLRPRVVRRQAVVSTGALYEATSIDVQVSLVSDSVKTLSLELHPSDEILVRWPYLRSYPENAIVSTRLLLDWRHLRTSIASGLWLLTRVHLPQAGAVALNSDDPHTEMACLMVPADAAVVINPQALCAIVQRQGGPVPISRHWQLSSALAWLTLQLRVVVVQGPVTLVIAGYGGVRVEPVLGSRKVHESCTLAYSTSVARSVRRREPMVPYLFGRQSLFDNQFTCNNSGVVVTAGRSRQSEPGRKPEGSFGRIVDGVLRAFGI